MATADNSGGGGGAKVSACARDFVADRLGDADTPMSPAELADEYDCTNGHIRNVLADLRDEGEVKRVARGKYTEPESAPDVPDVDIEAEIPADSEGDTEEDTSGADAYPSADGGRPSEATDTVDQGGREDGEMPTPEEYENQNVEELEDSNGGLEETDEDNSESSSGGDVDESSEGSDIDPKAAAAAGGAVAAPSVGKVSEIETKYIIIAAIVVIVVSWLLLSGDDEEAEETEESGETDDDAVAEVVETVGDTVEEPGGLI